MRPTSHAASGGCQSRLWLCLRRWPRPRLKRRGHQRIVSLIPAITEMIFAIGAGDRLVGVSDFDRYPPEVARLPRVGALLDPDIERILALKPDLVIVYNTQVELKQRLDRAGIPVLLVPAPGARRHHDDRFERSALASGRPSELNALAAEMERSIAAIRAVGGRIAASANDAGIRARAVSLRNIYASGGYGFLHDMLEVAGGETCSATSSESRCRRAPR